MSALRATNAPEPAVARLEEETAPQTYDAFGRLLPLENHTNLPALGEVLLYPGRYSETEIIFPYGGARFASIVGQLVGNQYPAMVTEVREQLGELGRNVL